MGQSLHVTLQCGSLGTKLTFVYKVPGVHTNVHVLTHITHTHSNAQEHQERERATRSGTCQEMAEDEEEDFPE